MSANEMTIGTVLRAHAPRAPESLRTRVLALEPRRAPSRRLVLVLALALGAALAAAIVHGLVSSGSKPKEMALSSTVPHVARALAPVTSSGSGGAAHGEAQKLPSVVGAPTRLQHTDASLEVRVENTSAATTKATRIATSLGGYAQSVNYNSAPGGEGTARTPRRTRDARLAESVRHRPRARPPARVGSDRAAAAHRRRSRDGAEEPVASGCAARHPADPAR